MKPTFQISSTAYILHAYQTTTKQTHVLCYVHDLHVYVCARVFESIQKKQTGLLDREGAKHLEHAILVLDLVLFEGFLPRQQLDTVDLSSCEQCRAATRHLTI